jgi:hypothetical protein
MGFSDEGQLQMHKEKADTPYTTTLSTPRSLAGIIQVGAVLAPEPTWSYHLSS